MEHTEGSSRRRNTQEESGVDAQNLNRLIVIVGVHRIFEHQPHFHGQCARDHDIRRSATAAVKEDYGQQQESKHG